MVFIQVTVVHKQIDHLQNDCMTKNCVSQVVERRCKESALVLPFVYTLVHTLSPEPSTMLIASLSLAAMSSLAIADLDKKYPIAYKINAW